MTVSSKIRLYDLAKELKLDTKRLIEEVRREGVDVSVPSNSVSKELAEKIRNKYFPKKEAAVKRTVRGSSCGNFSWSRMPMSSISSHESCSAIRASVSFRNIVAVPCGNLYYDLAGLLHHCLASETGVELEIGSHIQPVGFVIFYLIQ